MKLSISLAAVLMAASTVAGAESLRGPDAFTGIEDQAERSKALFTEAGKVLQHPRCVNCHPAGDRPGQGEDMHLHVPPVQRGPANFGVVGMQCTTCHQKDNVDYAEMPGHPKWHLAPIEMAWYGKTLTEICEQIKDPERNGDMSLDELVEHAAHDSLVGWGWDPGKGREPAPGSQMIFGALIDAWVETGAECPAESEPMTAQRTSG